MAMRAENHIIAPLEMFICDNRSLLPSPLVNQLEDIYSELNDHIRVVDQLEEELEKCNEQLGEVIEEECTVMTILKRFMEYKKEIQEIKEELANTDSSRKSHVHYLKIKLERVMNECEGYTKRLVYMPEE